jgi:hypothetical protein
MLMRRLALVLVLFAFAACEQEEGTRCNPLEYSPNGIQGNCEEGLACVYPTAPTCGVAYCCKVDSNGNILSTNPNCQPDPSLDSVCMLDLSPATDDGGAGD